MIPGRINGATRYLGAPADWNPEQDGDCCHLAIADLETENGLPLMVSVWEPTPAELEILAAGGRIYLQIVGRSHPPVMVHVPPMEIQFPGASA